MSELPFYIQQAADYGLIEIQDGKIVGCKKEETETVLGVARLVEKIQPTTVAKIDSTIDQESIVLCRVLSSASGKARELWSALRVAFGVGHGQTLPQNLWSTSVLRAIGTEIDLTFLGERNAALISPESLILQYESLTNGSRITGFQDFAKTVSKLANPETIKSYGDSQSEWETALDLLRQARVHSLYKETLHVASQVSRSDSKLEDNIEFLQSRAMECLGMLRGSIGQQGDAIDIVEDLIGNAEGEGFLDKLMNARAIERPVSTGVEAFDIDMEGGIYRPSNIANGGRIFTLAARTGVGKTQLGVQIVAKAATEGLTAGYVSVELDRPAIYSRLWASITKKVLPKCLTSGQIAAPAPLEKESIVAALMEAGGVIQDRGGKLLVEAPWGADVNAVINSMRSMKAKNPQLRLVVLDHFHCLARHKGAPSNESAALEERAYKLVSVAKELDIDLIVLAQMNRVGMDVLSRKSAPQLNEIRGTDALAHVSHAVWILRLEPKDDESDSYSRRNMELWHSKVRGRQAYWNSEEKLIRGCPSFIEKSIIDIDHATSSVIFDNTMNLVHSVR